MTREIKFRAWTGLTMEYSIVFGKYGAFYVNPGKNNDGLSETDKASLTYANTKYPETVPIMQYTGLHDKNGKEIWEGDTVKVSPDEGDTWDKGIVEYGNYASFVVSLPKIGTGLKSPLLNFCVGTMGVGGADIYIEVIGNIYENPELLS